MATAVLTAVTTPVDLPAGTVAGLFRFVVIPSTSPAVSQDETGPVSTFANLAVDTYTATCQRLDSNGALFGPVASASFQVVATQFDAPQSLTVALS